MAKRFTKDEIRILSANPNVKHIRENRLTLTFEFRNEMYREWIKDPCTSTIRKFLNDNGIDTMITGDKFVCDIHKNFKKYGCPSNGKNKEFGVGTHSFKTNKDDNEYLISSGVFIKSRKGITFSKEFIAEASLNYPDKTVVDKLKEKGINPEIVGYHRIYSLERKLNNGSSIKEKSSYSDDVKSKYSNHPYVKKISDKQFSLKDVFYKNAKLFEDLNVDEILNIFNFGSNDFSFNFKARMMTKLRNQIFESDEFIDDISILTNRANKLEEMIDKNNDDLKSLIKSSTKLSKKEVVKLINENFDNKVEIANNLGISKSSFYSILKNDNYGKYEANKNNRDADDYKEIKKVLDSDPYPMGKRMIYMKMDSICGFHFSIKKISRLLRINNSLCPVRKKVESSKEIRDLTKRNTKPNILNRRFKLAKPNKIKLTDVTYLKYGENKTAYKSTIKDSVTGKIDACVISNNNDLNLVMDTINNLDNNSYVNGAIFHSDQGALYLNDYFQNRIKEMGLIQSMSKRGNSQDNAACESYFGHFKDECDYASCSTIDDVIKEVNNYIDYYNNRRPQWNRNRMTPAEYEKYLLSLNDEEYNSYLKIEEDKYLKMKERAKDLAIKRNKTLGVEDYYGIIT